ncbi:MAG: hypothetical protein IKK29_05605 [Christensenellaceae bacterium]|nr:hypothetical protein [Christensenellaceae bacterium]
MNTRKKVKNKAPLLTAGIVLLLVGLMGEAFVLMPIGIVLIVFHILLKKKGKQKNPPQQERQYAKPEQPQFERQKRSSIEYDAETKRAHKRREEDHSIRRTQYAQFSHAPHVRFEDMMQQAQAEIRNLKNIRYARSELTGRTLSDTVIWHSRKGVCASVVQVIRQGNLRYPDLSDRELSERILADHDLMEDLARCLEWEKRTEIRWS